MLLEKANKKQYDIVLTVDFNEAIGDDKSLFTQIILDLKLIDVHSYKHRYNCDISIFFLGNKQLDYFFVSWRIIDHVTQCGYELFKLHINSDHQVYFVDFSVVELFDYRLLLLLTPISHHMNSYHPGNVHKFIYLLSLYIKEHKLLCDVKKLQYKFDLDKAEKLNEIITAGILAAEKKCYTSYCLPCDKEIHEVITKKNTMLVHLSGIYNQVDLSSITLEKLKKIRTI